ncbi:MAG: hypothetical protein Fur0041_12630 [Bacteroidia bacterium]
MMKKLLSVLTLVSAFSFVQAQQSEKCASMSILHQHQLDPTVAARMSAVQSAAKAWSAVNTATRGGNGPVLTIPVVVHVVYKNATQNITDQQVYSQIAVLNQDYRRLNADTVNTPAYFDSIAADIQVEFCLATLDPQGNPTNGITRTPTSGGQLFGYFSPLDDVKSAATGGVDPWPTDKYLNIWVCELFPGLLGYAQFPGDNPATDGVVITYTAFGNMGTVTAPSTLGRTATHEVGHWMGLYHIWGDDQDCVTGSDSIPDTPNATAASSSDCQVSRNSCSNEDPWWGTVDPNDMVQNYMDYSNDSCMNMFTNMQKMRMHGFLYNDSLRFALFSSPAGCNPLGMNQTAAFEKYFSLYPNPTDGIINVSYFGSWNSTVSIDIISMTGAVVRSFNAWGSSYTLDCSGLSSGVYSVKISGEGGSGFKKIVIQ